MSRIDWQSDEVAYGQVAGKAARRPTRGPAVRIARAQLVSAAAAPAAAIEIDAVGINRPMRLDIFDRAQHVGFRQRAVAGAPAAAEHGEIERPRVGAHAG